MTFVDNNTPRADRPDIVLINAERHLDGAYDIVAVLKEQHGVPNAMVIKTSNPTAQWLAANHMSALSDEQRASFEADGVVMLLQHPIDPNFTIWVGVIAKAAVDFGLTQLAVDLPEIAQVIERVDGMPYRERMDFFVSAYIDMAEHDDGRGIIAKFTQAELDVALSNAWATRKFVMLNGRAAVPPQGA